MIRIKNKYLFLIYRLLLLVVVVPKSSIKCILLAYLFKKTILININGGIYMVNI